jgi:kynurenine 3-monooxygenase
MDVSKKKVVVVGGGLVGPIASIMFRRKGFNVTLVEKRKDFRKLNEEGESKSIYLGVTSKGLYALRQMNLWEKSIECTSANTKRYIGIKGKGHQIFEFGHELYQADRGALNKKFLSLAEEEGVKTHFDWETNKVDFINQSIFNKKNDKLQYDYLIGADGLHSEVRRELYENIKDKVKVRDVINKHPAKYLELHLNIPKERFQNAQTNWNVPHVGIIIGFPKKGIEEYSISIFLKQEIIDQLGRDKQKINNFFMENFPDIIEVQKDIADQYLSHKFGSLGTLDAYPWAWKNVCLIGDAAHAVTPFIGQGMNLGLFEVEIISKLIEKHGKNNIENSFDEFQKTQKENADAVARMAWGNFVDFTSPPNPISPVIKMLEPYLLRDFLIIGVLSLT